MWTALIKYNPLGFDEILILSFRCFPSRCVSQTYDMPYLIEYTMYSAET